MKALQYALGALLALAVLAAAFRVALVMLAVIVFAALIFDPSGTLKRLGTMTIALLLWAHPVAALLIIIAALLASLVVRSHGTGSIDTNR